MDTRAARLFDIRTLVTAGAILLAVAISIALLVPRLLDWPLSPDFTMLWAGARFAVTQPHDTYDVAAVTAAQMGIRPSVGPLPFPYPPSALPLLAPFGLLPFWPSYFAVDRPVRARLLDGRTANHADAVAGLRHAPGGPRDRARPDHAVDRRFADLGCVAAARAALLAGLLFGIAAAVKPQFAILIPVALLAGRHWRAIGGAVAGFVAMLLLSLPFGLFLWPDWLAMIGQHPGIVSGYGLDMLGASPMLALKVLGLPLWLDLPFVLFAVWLVWRAFRADDVKMQVLILLAATLIASPYAIRYELAMLAPSLVDALVAGTIRGLLIALPLYCLNVLAIVPALIVSLMASTFVSTDKDP